MTRLILPAAASLALVRRALHIFDEWQAEIMVLHCTNMAGRACVGQRREKEAGQAEHER